MSTNLCITTAACVRRCEYNNTRIILNWQIRYYYDCLHTASVENFPPPPEWWMAGQREQINYQEAFLYTYAWRVCVYVCVCKCVRVYVLYALMAVFHRVRRNDRSKCLWALCSLSQPLAKSFVVSVRVI